MANYTDEQKRAFQAGKVFGTAKVGGRVSCKDENKQSFREGVKAGKAAAKAAKKAGRRRFLY